MMTVPRIDADAIVVGAGPAGATAALHLARKKRRVLLLDKCAFPRDKSCGDGLTRSAVCLLDEMGVLPLLRGATKISGVRVIVKGKAARDFAYSSGHEPHEIGLVVPRLELDATLCRRAVAEGAEFWEGAHAHRLIYRESRVVGVEVEHQGNAKQLHARVIVAADGTSSHLALQAGLIGTAPQHFGFAIRGYYSGVQGLTDLFEFYMPLLDATDRYLLPSYGWVFPTGADTVNVGVGVFHRQRGANVRRLMEQFLEFLVDENPRFKNARPCSGWLGAPLRFDFAPNRCMADGLLLVGDAAGLISPFTGEGISYALSSGRLAAEVIHNSLQNGDEDRLDLDEYKRCLSESYTGYFESGRHAARRYVLTWHVIESTFRNDRPLFSLCRRAVLFPEGVAEQVAPATVEDVSPLIFAPVHRLKSNLGSVSALVTETVRREWPVLVQLAPPGEQELGVLLRPAMLLLLCYYLGAGKDENAVLAGAAVELGYLAALAHSSVGEDPPEGSASRNDHQTNWGNLFALSMGDFLLSKAYELSARVGPAATSVISEALARATEARVSELQQAHNFELTSAEQLDIIGCKTATFFELPCRLGAECGALDKAKVEAVARYGRELGITYYLVDELLEVTEKGEPLGRAAGMDLLDGIYSMPIRCALRHQSVASKKLQAILAARSLGIERANEVRQLVRETDAVSEVLLLATQRKQRAQDVLRTLDEGPIRQTLWGLADSALGRMKP